MSRWLRTSSAVSGSSRISSRGLRDERLGDGDALPLTAGQLGQPAVGELGRVDGRQDLVDAAALLGGRRGRNPNGCRSIRAARRRRPGSRCPPRRRSSAARSRSARWPRPAACRAPGSRRRPIGIMPEHGVQQRRLARAARPDDGDDPAGRDVEGALRPDQPPAADDADVVERQRRRRRGRPGRQAATPSALARAVSWSTCQASNDFGSRRHRFGHVRPPGRPRLRRRCGSVRAPSPRSGCCRSARRRPSRRAVRGTRRGRPGDGSVSLLAAAW